MSLLSFQLLVLPKSSPSCWVITMVWADVKELATVAHCYKMDWRAHVLFMFKQRRMIVYTYGQWVCNDKSFPNVRVFIKRFLIKLLLFFHYQMLIFSTGFITKVFSGRLAVLLVFFNKLVKIYNFNISAAKTKVMGFKEDCRIVIHN